MSTIRRLVLDVLKAHEPSIITYADQLAGLERVSAVNIVVMEVDRIVENIKVTIQGEKLDYTTIEKEIKDLGGSIHSIDLVIAGKHIIEETPTHQD
ncbi:MAG: DUF211 domain-containing protein [Candidatus Heimdallarchaeota archaeon]|nr:MAG: DUF211 domain-containing protein [Candidatus Heimdallarchaeota archaeon]